MYTYVYYIYNITIQGKHDPENSPHDESPLRKKKMGVRTIWGQAARVTLKAPFR